MAGYSKRSVAHPAPSGKMVKFYLERTQFMDPQKRYILPVGVNGYVKQFEFGKSHEAEEEYVQHIEQARSAYIQSNALDRFADGWRGRPQAQAYAANPEQSYQHVPDYGVRREN
jgi:hypothetical protein